MPRVVHFEIYADDPARAERFYGKLFGWTFRKWEDDEYWSVVTGSADERGIDGGMIRRHGGIDGHAVTAFVCTVGVPDVDATAAAIESSGGAVVVPKRAVPGVGWVLYANDTEGNVFGCLQADETLEEEPRSPDG